MDLTDPYNAVNSYFDDPHLSGVYIYTCTLLSVLSQVFFKNGSTYSNVQSYVKLIQLTNKTDSEDLYDVRRKFLNVGVFLDLTCNEGVEFYKKASSKIGFMGRTYRWLLYSESDDAPLWLEKLNFCWDSDVTLLSPSGIYDLYKVHRTTPLIMNLRASDPKAVTEIYPKPDRWNLMGYQMNAAHAVIDIMPNNWSDIELFEDRFYMPDSHPVPRFTLSWYFDIAKKNNFSYNYTLVTSWGNEDDEGNWSGMMGVLQRYEVELSFSQVYVRIDRMSACDFIFNLKEDKVMFVFLQPAAFGTSAALTMPFSFEIWMYVGGFLILIIIVARLFQTFDESPEFDSWGSIIEFSLGNVTQQGPNDTLKSTASRVIALSVFMYSFFVCMYYNAAVLSGLLSPTPNLITSLSQLMDSNMKFGVLDFPYFRDFSVQGVYGPMNDKRIRLFKILQSQERMFYTIQDGIDRVKVGRFALLTDGILIFRMVKLRFNDVQICNTFIIIHEIPKMNCATVINKITPFRELFSRQLMMLEERGLKDYNYLAWIDKMPACNWRQEALSIGMEALSLAFYLLLIATCLSLIIFSLEIIKSRIENIRSIKVDEKTKKKGKRNIRFVIKLPKSYKF